MALSRSREPSLRAVYKPRQGISVQSDGYTQRGTGGFGGCRSERKVGG